LIVTARVSVATRVTFKVVVERRFAQTFATQRHGCALFLASVLNTCGLGSSDGGRDRGFRGCNLGRCGLGGCGLGGCNLGGGLGGCNLRGGLSDCGFGGCGRKAFIVLLGVAGGARVAVAARVAVGTASAFSVAVAAVATLADSRGACGS